MRCNIKTWRSHETRIIFSDLVSPFEAEGRVINIQEFSPYLNENTTRHHYKQQFVNALKGSNRCLQ
jgi:hypothetical protein